MITNEEYAYYCRCGLAIGHYLIKNRTKAEADLENLSDILKRLEEIRKEEYHPIALCHKDLL